MKIEIEVPTGTTIDSNNEVQQIILKVQEKNILLIKKIREIQKKCDHSFKENLENQGVFEKKILLSKVCRKCGKTKEKPKGSPWKICIKCWGKMNYLGKSPGQGGDGKSFYKCTDCGNLHSHT